MRTKGVIKSIDIAYPSRRAVVAFEVTAAPELIQTFVEMELDISFDKHREKRSLDANAYFWVLVNQIAEKLNVSDIEVHDRLLSENICYILKDGVLDWEVKGEEPGKYGILRDKTEYYLCSGATVQIHDPKGKPLQKNGVPISRLIYWHIKGSHQMDTKEMSRLIDSTIVEAKELGIEVATPEDIRQMTERWGAKFEKSNKE